MKTMTSGHIKTLIERYPKLTVIESDIVIVYDTLKDAFLTGQKLLVCGNGGSAADADHIVGELMKGFLYKRPLDRETMEKINKHDNTGTLSNNLQKALPAINLSSHLALNTAIGNDISFDMIFAQQVLGYGIAGDVLLGISTSGNSMNVVNAGIVAKSIGMRTIGLAGETGGKMDKLFDIVIKVPSRITTEIQEYHLPIYHTLCAMLEEEFFGSEG